jgi:ADP-heptose:LPS heptosyltransferase
MTSRPAAGRRILVIRHGALGDFVQALGPMQAIRRHHADAGVTLLTSSPFIAVGEASGWFDRVWVDDRSPIWRVGDWLALRRRLREAGFDRVYDLQTSHRTSLYFRMLGPGPRPEWSGVAPGCSHPHANPHRIAMHTVDRQAEQLRLAGIAEVPPPDLAWLDADIGRFDVLRPFVLLVPGGAVHRPAKRWPAERYAELASSMLQRGYCPVLLGGPDEVDLTSGIAASAPGAVDLAGQTTMLEVAGLARRAAAGIGNDTGPMHILATVGCPTVILFSKDSEPARCAPQGPSKTVVLQRPSLAGLASDTVLDAFNEVRG